MASRESTTRSSWGVATINLIPAGRLLARKSFARARLWMVVVPCSAGFLVAAYAISWLGWDTDTRPLTAALSETEAKMKETQARIAKQGRELREADAKLKANLAVGEQPDWSVLLDLLASKLGTDASLRSCVLEPVAAVKSSKETEKAGGRPEELKLTMKGVAATQAAVSKFVLDLEQSKAFDLVQLVETKREREGAENVAEIAFEVVCQLSDPGGSLK